MFLLVDGCLGSISSADLRIWVWQVFWARAGVGKMFCSGLMIVICTKGSTTRQTLFDLMNLKSGLRAQSDMHHSSHFTLESDIPQERVDGSGAGVEAETSVNDLDAMLVSVASYQSCVV